MCVVFPHKSKRVEKMEKITTHSSIKRAPCLASLSLSLCAVLAAFLYSPCTRSFERYIHRYTRAREI